LAIALSGCLAVCVHLITCFFCAEWPPAAPEPSFEEWPRMDNKANQPSASGTNWTPTQTYAMAAVCLVIGVLVGYLVRGSARPAAQTTPAEMQQATGTPPPGMPQAASAPPPGMPQGASAPPSGMGQQKMPTLDEMKRMTDKQAEPLLAKLKTDPKNADLLAKIALTYKAGHQFKEAIAYFQKSLDVDPKNVTVRTVMASCMYYTGDVDGALAELNKSLTYDPKHAGTLMNIGIIK